MSIQDAWHQVVPRGGLVGPACAELADSPSDASARPLYLRRRLKVCAQEIEQREEGWVAHGEQSSGPISLSLLFFTICGFSDCA